MPRLIELAIRRDEGDVYIMGSGNEVENNLNTGRSRIIVPLLAFSANRSLKPAISARLIRPPGMRLANAHD